MNLREIYSIPNYVLESMDNLEKSVENLFSNAPHLNQDELSHTFNDLMKTGKRALELSGKNYLFFIKVFRPYYKKIYFRKQNSSGKKIGNTFAKIHGDNG